MRTARSFGGSNFVSLGDNVGTIEPLTSEQVSNAQHYVASRATDADDLRLLLDALDLRGGA